jgi:LiaF transmembrane domain
LKQYASPESLTLGLLLTALGVLWTLSNFGVLEMLPLLRRWWPLSLLAWGVLELWAARQERSERGPGEGADARPGRRDP